MPIGNNVRLGLKAKDKCSRRENLFCNCWSSIRESLVKPVELKSTWVSCWACNATQTKVRMSHQAHKLFACAPTCQGRQNCKNTSVSELGIIWYVEPYQRCAERQSLTNIIDVVLAQSIIAQNEARSSSSSIWRLHEFQRIKAERQAMIVPGCWLAAWTNILTAKLPKNLKSHSGAWQESQLL